MGVITGCCILGSRVENLVAVFGEMAENHFFEIKTSVIAADNYLHSVYSISKIKGPKKAALLIQFISMNYRP
jgi:hypothetical protein